MICIFLGTRPEIIKMSPVIKELIIRKRKFFIVHTNQHFSKNMDSIFFEELNLPKPKYNLHLKSRTHGAMVGELIAKAEKIFLKEKPSIVLLQGDTNSVLAGAISAWKLGIKVGHIEAGLRSYDREMPEEINRKITDNISDFLFCPTKKEKEILIKENINANSIFVTGNTIVDAIKGVSKFVKINQRLTNSLKIITLTLHRPSNVDNEIIFQRILSAAKFLALKTGSVIYFPIHPRTKQMLEKFEIKLNKKVFRSLKPLSYRRMINLEKKSVLVLTDSGGIQEEACILGIPCVTLRENTERPETVEVGANIIAGTSKRGIVSAGLKMINKKPNWENPFGDGKAAQRIVTILGKKFN